MTFFKVLNYVFSLTRFFAKAHITKSWISKAVSPKCRNSQALGPLTSTVSAGHAQLQFLSKVLSIYICTVYIASKHYLTFMLFQVICIGFQCIMWISWMFHHFWLHVSSYNRINLSSGLHLTLTFQLQYVTCDWVSVLYILYMTFAEAFLISEANDVILKCFYEVVIRRAESEFSYTTWLSRLPCNWVLKNRKESTDRQR